MIELNVLKTRLEKFRKQRVVLNLFVIYFAGLVFLFMLLSMHFLGNKLYIRRIKNDIRTIEGKIAGESEKVEYIKAMEKESDLLLKNLALFSAESEKRILWSPILAFTGQNVPSGIWLEKFAAKPVASSNDTVTLAITGYVLPGMVNGREAIDKFVRDMSRGGVFASVSLKEVKKEMRDITEVLYFEIECELRQKRSVVNVVETSD